MVSLHPRVVESNTMHEPSVLDRQMHARWAVAERPAPSEQLPLTKWPSEAKRQL